MCNYTFSPLQIHALQNFPLIVLLVFSKLIGETSGFCISAEFSLKAITFDEICTESCRNFQIVSEDSEFFKIASKKGELLSNLAEHN